MPHGTQRSSLLTPIATPTGSAQTTPRTPHRQTAGGVHGGSTELLFDGDDVLSKVRARSDTAGTNDTTGSDSLREDDNGDDAQIFALEPSSSSTKEED